MTAAVKEFARWRRDPNAWILGRFIVPAERLDELEAAARPFLPRGRAARQWSIAALVGEDHEAGRNAIDAFNRSRLKSTAGRPPGRATVDAVELKPTGAEEVARAARAFEGMEVFYELSYETDPGPLMAAVAAYGGRAKLRAGGVTADAFPTPAEVIRFLRAAERTGVPFKATAGLHHPLRGEYALAKMRGGPQGTMHGFVNIFLAAAWIAAEGMDEEEAVALLEERDAKAFSFSDDEVRWGERRLSGATLKAVRGRFALAFGSCSIAEPVRALKSMKML